MYNVDTYHHASRAASLGNVCYPAGRRVFAAARFFIVNVALPAIQGELGASSSAEQLVISSYAAVYAVTLITGGRLGDIWSWKDVLSWAGRFCCRIAAVRFSLVTMGTDYRTGVTGATAAIMAPQALASVQAIFPEAEKPLALSIYGAVFGLASVIGQVLGGILISVNLFHLGWRAIFSLTCRWRCWSFSVACRW